MIKQTLEEWQNEAACRFGNKGREWQFKCPKCESVQTGQDFIDAGMTLSDAQGRAYFSCIGRWVEGKGCNWTAGGLFGTLGKGRIVIDPDGVEHEVFEFGNAKEDAN